MLADPQIEAALLTVCAIMSPQRAAHFARYARCENNDEDKSEMPELCRFLGIVIGMFYREHGVPHFHAV